MNGTPTASGQGLCAIDRLEFKVTKSSVKSTGNPHSAKLDLFQNRKLSVEFRCMRISGTFDTSFSNFELYTIDSI